MLVVAPNGNTPLSFGMTYREDEPAFCGLGTLVMCLNALGVDPRREWKGPWRWYTESMLSCQYLGSTCCLLPSVTCMQAWL